jgi:CYTH domain-containing protein
MSKDDCRNVGDFVVRQAHHERRKRNHGGSKVTNSLTADRGLDTEMADPKYARLELERRWLVDTARRATLDGHAMTLIEDRYVEGTRLRLRRMSRPDLGEVKLKLTKKYECADSAARPIVTAYLTETEYELLLALPARELAKRRCHLQFEGHYWSLDVFEGALEGLEMVECEVEDEATLAALVPPDWSLREVTHSPEGQCGALASQA